MSGLSSFLEASRIRAAASVRCGLSPLTAMVLTSSSKGLVEKSGVFLLAFSGLREGNIGWTTARGLIAMARHIYDNEPVYQTMEDHEKDCLYFGALTALWSVPETTITDENIMNARSRIIRSLRRIPPKPAVVSAAIAQWIHVYQQLEPAYYHQAAHIFPVNLSPGMSDAIASVIVSGCPTANHPPNVQMTALTAEQETALRAAPNQAHINSIWSRLPDNSILAFFSIWGMADETFAHDQIRAMFTQIATLGKSSFTERWVNSRWENLLADDSSLANTEPVSREVLLAYATRFQTIASDKIKIAGLVHNYHLAKAANMTSVMRMVEQSKAPHVGGLTALCEMTRKYSVVTYTSLKATFGESQVNAVINLAAQLLYNPYCSMSGPPITQAFYADIAYVAADLMYNTNRRGQAKYVVPATQHMTKSVAFLKAYAASLASIEAAQGSVDTTLANLITCYGYRTISNDDGTITVTPGVNPNNMDGDDEARVLTHAEIPGFIESVLGERDRAFKQLMTALQSALAQSPMDDVVLEGNNWAHPVLNTIPLSPEISRALSELGVAVSEDLLRPVNLIDDPKYANYKIGAVPYLQTQHCHVVVPPGAAAPPVNPPPQGPRRQ